MLGRLAASLDGPPYNLVLHTAPLKEQVDATYHWHWEIHPRLREIAGLELGTGLPVNPVSPEDAVEELGADGRGRPPSPAGWRPRGASHEPAATVLAASWRTRRHGPSRRCGAPIPQRRLRGRTTFQARQPPLVGGPRRERELGPGRAHAFVEELFAKHHARDLRVPDADAARPRARRGPHPGRVRQGATARTTRSRRRRTPARGSTRSPTGSRSTTFAAARSSGSCRSPARREHRAVRRAPRDGRSGSRATSSGPWSGSRSASAPRSSSPSSTTSPGSSWPRPGRVARGGPRAPHPRPREPPPGARRRRTPSARRAEAERRRHPTRPARGGR